jgi:hypothetical protein
VEYIYWAPGFAAAARDASKRRAYQQVSPALPFVPMSVESFERLRASALTLLADLAEQAVQAGGPGLSLAAFISGAHRELSIALCRGNASLFRSGAYVATRAAGGPFLPSLSVNLFWALGRSGASGGLRLSAVACLPVTLGDMCGCVWILPRVACVCLCLASPLCLFGAHAVRRGRPPCMYWAYMRVPALYGTALA